MTTNVILKPESARWRARTAAARVSLIDRLLRQRLEAQRTMTAHLALLGCTPTATASDKTLYLRLLAQASDGVLDLQEALD